MLRIHETAIELVREVMPLLEVIERRGPDLARQGRRAGDEYAAQYCGGQ